MRHVGDHTQPRTSERMRLQGGDMLVDSDELQLQGLVGCLRDLRVCLVCSLGDVVSDEAGALARC
eukprot:5623537-Lingulodinium_polyedra.AAC.1